MAEGARKAGGRPETVLIVLLLVTGGIGLSGRWWPGAVFALLVAVLLLIRVAVRRRSG